MKVLIATPSAKGSTRGNRTTADRYAEIFKALGHRVSIVDSSAGKRFSRIAKQDLLVALHAGRSASMVARFQKELPDRPVVVVVTGTDVNRDLLRSSNSRERKRVVRSLQSASRIVVLQPGALGRLSRTQQMKSVVIRQSAIPVSPAPSHKSRGDAFEIVVSGHLRPVKDPFRAAMAARMLPAESKIVVTHIGESLQHGMKTRAKKLDAAIERYSYLGGFTHSQTMQIIAHSRILVSSSRNEGGPAVVGEAIVNGVPIIASKINSHVGLLGATYPGFYPYGDTKQLGRLMLAAETNRKFYRQLKSACRKLKQQFSPALESRNWKQLLGDL